MAHATLTDLRGPSQSLDPAGRDDPGGTLKPTGGGSLLSGRSLTISRFLSGREATSGVSAPGLPRVSKSGCHRRRRILPQVAQEDAEHGDMFRMPLWPTPPRLI